MIAKLSLCIQYFSNRDKIYYSDMPEVVLHEFLLSFMGKEKEKSSVINKSVYKMHRVPETQAAQSESTF